MTTLPCFVGDADPLLVRVPGANLHMYGTVCFSHRADTQDRSACGSSRVRIPQARRVRAASRGLSVSRD